MSINERLRHYWHEFYFKFSSPAGVEFAMRCKEVVEQIDIGDQPMTWRRWFRLKLHLSFCQQCNYYFRLSETLRRALRKTIHNSESKFDLEKVNQELLERYAQDPSRARKK